VLLKLRTQRKRPVDAPNQKPFGVVDGRRAFVTAEMKHTI